MPADHWQGSKHRWRPQTRGPAAPWLDWLAAPLPCPSPSCLSGGLSKEEALLGEGGEKPTTADSSMHHISLFCDSEIVFSVYVRWHLCTLETVVLCLLPIMPQNTENHQVNKLIFVVETKYKKLMDFIVQYIHCEKLCLSVWGFSVFLSKCNMKESFMPLGKQLEFDTLSLQLTCWQTSAFKRSGALFVFVLKGSCRIRLWVTM